jgi:hypothetical protein
MPSKSPAQARLMAGVAHNPAFAKKVGISQKVGKDFNAADTGTGILRGSRPAPSVAHTFHSYPKGSK